MTATRQRWMLAGGLLLVALVYWALTGYSGHERLATIAIFAIVAMSLDLMVGFAGMVSLGHALFFGMGAYAMAGFTVFAKLSAAPAMLLSVLTVGIGALVIGALVVRLGGVFFIMITLAAGQMAFAYVEKARVWGGNGGMSGVPRLDLDAIGIDFSQPGAFALLALGIAALVFIALDRIVRSPFGQVLVALHQNPQRTRALGAPVTRYKLAAFTVSGMLAGLAGTLMAQLTGFVSPDLMLWTQSGEILIMVIVGGAGSLAGPAAGAALWILLRHALAGWTAHWMFAMGLVFIAVVLVSERGLFGALTRRRRSA